MALTYEFIWKGGKWEMMADGEINRSSGAGGGEWDGGEARDKNLTSLDLDECV